MHGEIEFNLLWSKPVKWNLLLLWIKCQYKWGSGGGGCKYTSPFLMKKVKTFVNVYNSLF